MFFQQARSLRALGHPARRRRTTLLQNQLLKYGHLHLAEAKGCLASQCSLSVICVQRAVWVRWEPERVQSLKAHRVAAAQTPGAWALRATAHSAAARAHRYNKHRPSASPHLSTHTHAHTPLL